MPTATVDSTSGDLTTLCKLPVRSIPASAVPLRRRPVRGRNGNPLGEVLARVAQSGNSGAP